MESELLTSVVLIPDSVIDMCRPNELALRKQEVQEGLRSGFAFVVGTTEGNLRVFASFSLPEKTK